MDKDDILILQMLKEGKPIQEIQKKLGVSRQSVYYRIQKLRKEIGLQDTIKADFEKVGYKTTILCLIKWNFQDYKNLIDFIEGYIIKNPHLCVYTILLGEWDAVAVFACESQSQYYDEVLHTILMNGGPHVRSWVSLPITKIQAGGINLPDLVGSLLKKG